MVGIPRLPRGERKRTVQLLSKAFAQFPCSLPKVTVVIEERAEQPAFSTLGKRVLGIAQGNTVTLDASELRRMGNVEVLLTVWHELTHIYLRAIKHPSHAKTLYRRLLGRLASISSAVYIIRQRQKVGFVRGYRAAMFRQADLALILARMTSEVFVEEFLATNFKAAYEIHMARILRRLTRRVNWDRRQNPIPYGFIRTLLDARSHARTHAAWVRLVSATLLYPHLQNNFAKAVLGGVDPRERKTWSRSLSRLSLLRKQLLRARSCKAMLRMSTHIVQAAHEPMLRFRTEQRWKSLAKKHGLKRFYSPIVITEG